MVPLGSFLQGRSVVTRLIVYIILFSSAVTLVTTSLQLYREYRRDLDAVVDAVEHLRLSHLDSLSNSLWTLDAAQIQLIVDGMARIPDIRRVEVASKSGSVYRAGKAGNGPTRSYTFPLVHDEGSRQFTLGELRVIVDLDTIYGRLLDRVWIILLSNGVRTFAVSSFLFLLFQRLVTRHLRQIANHARQVSPQTLDQPLQLNRAAHRGDPDEIDQLAMSINTMRENLRRSYLALSESESRFRHIAECIDAVFWIGSPDWQNVMYVSPAYEKVWGRPCAELYRSPLSWTELIHPTDKPKVERTIAEAMATLTVPAKLPAQLPRIDFQPYRVVQPGGATRWVLARAFPLADDSGELRYIVGIAEDVTDRVSANEALLAAKEMAEQANQAKSQFLAHMSHELRTPLNAILGFSEMMEREMLGPIQPPAYRDYACDIQRSGRLLLSIINDILDLSRIEAGKVAINLEQLQPGTLVEEALTLVAKQAAEKNLDVQNRLPPDLPSVRADRRAIIQVLTNVLTNAVKFTAEGGKVQVGSAPRRDGGIDLQIEDTGCGIAPEEMKELFKPFARRNPLTARDVEGTGLGLAICKQLMELQGLSITVRSTVGKGTLVTLRFPGNPADELPDKRARPAERKATG